MTTERVIEIPWSLAQLPQSGLILDVGSCEATYLSDIVRGGRRLHCLDTRDCGAELPPEALFFPVDLIDCELVSEAYDAVLAVSVIEHIGLPFYGQEPFPEGDVRAMREIWRLLRKGAPCVITVPAGQSKLASWYRQYSPADLHRLFDGWLYRIRYWGFDGKRYVEIGEDDVEEHDYRDRHDVEAGAGALAGIVAYRPPESYVGEGRL